MESRDKINCWNFKNCGRQPGGINVESMGICPASLEKSCDGLNSGNNSGRICWVTAGTFCGGKIQGDFASKLISCIECGFFQRVKEEETQNFKFLLPGHEYQEIEKTFLNYIFISKEIEKTKEEFAAAAVDAEKKKAEELRGLNQQLKASEQQLQAANQQLRASEQQMKTANQQLRAIEQALQSSHKELTSKMADLERINKLMVGRELVMIKLKKKVNSLLKELGRPAEYEEV